MSLMSSGTSPGTVSLPASTSVTRSVGSSDSRAAIAAPAEPAPTTKISLCSMNVSCGGRLRADRASDDPTLPSYNLFHDAVSEVLLLGITAHVLKRQHSDRGFVRSACDRAGPSGAVAAKALGIALVTRVSILTLPPSLQPSCCKACRTGVRRHRSGSCRS